MTDISKIQPITKTIEIINPHTDELLGVRVSLVSLDDERTKRQKRKIMDRRQQLESKGKYMKAEEVESNQRDLLFSCMTGWEWYAPSEGEDVPTYEGEVPDFNRRNALSIFEKLTWFADQIDEALGETKSFFGNSKAT